MVIGSGADLYVLLFISSIYQSDPSRLKLHTRISVRIPSTSCAYHKGKVSLSPLQKRIAFGGHDSRKSIAMSLHIYLPERSWSFHSACAIITGTVRQRAVAINAA